MSDLISRSDVLELQRYSFGVSMLSLEEYIKVSDVNNILTSYSVDKVVEELEERTDFLKDCKKYGNKNAKQQAGSYNTMMMYEVADLVDDLIEIVKQGGASEAEQKLKEMESD